MMIKRMTELLGIQMFWKSCRYQVLDISTNKDKLNINHSRVDYPNPTVYGRK